MVGTNRIGPRQSHPAERLSQPLWAAVRYSSNVDEQRYHLQ